MLKINALIYTEVELVLELLLPTLMTFYTKKEKNTKKNFYNSLYICTCTSQNILQTLVFCLLKTKSQKLKTEKGVHPSILFLTNHLLL